MIINRTRDYYWCGQLTKFVNIIMSRACSHRQQWSFVPKMEAGPAEELMLIMDDDQNNNHHMTHRSRTLQQRPPNVHIASHQPPGGSDTNVIGRTRAGEMGGGERRIDTCSRTGGRIGNGIILLVGEICDKSRNYSPGPLLISAPDCI